MANEEWAPPFLDGPVQHARDCAYVLTPGSAACNCYRSWDLEVFSTASAFQPATARGPDDQNGNFDEHDQATIQAFISRKHDQGDERRLQRSFSLELYQPLTQGEIRILELYPGERDAPLQGSLHIASIDFTHLARASDQSTTRLTNHAISLGTSQPFWYTALSYVWGEPTFNQSVRFAARSVPITSSLATALFRLRSLEESIFLWIDQICINQTDTREKEQQIPLMGLIYTHATNTVIWLGDEDGQDPHLALETMEHVYAKLQMSDVEITPDDFERLDFPPANHHAWHAVRQILQRPWLSRLWTIQEAVLSRNLFVMCGNAVVNWDDLAAWCYVLQHCQILQWLASDKSQGCLEHSASCSRSRLPFGGSVINSLQADRLQNWSLSEKEYLLNSLVRTRYAQASDPKDKIYGVLGIARSNITPDYTSSRTARDVYHEACLTQLPALVYELLSCVDHDLPLEPSWLPDWSTNRVTEALGYSTKAWTMYSAGRRANTKGTVSIGRPSKVILSENKTRLTLNGIVFDKVTILGRTIEDVALDIEDPHIGNSSWASNVQLINENYKHEEYPASDSSVYDAFWKTLLGGRDASGTAEPTAEHSEVFSLILDSTTGQTPSLAGQTYSSRRRRGYFTLNSLRSRRPAKALGDLRTAMRAALTMRRFAISQKGFFALVPRGTQQGDVIVVFEGACVPFVLRSVQNEEEEYELLGEAYMHGIMQGEALHMPDMRFEDVTLV
ncbi:hypothetical protein HBI67_129250 [Parastagonospora nodorum]|nr:hypothetical protein HBI79_013180 [Parastagonospora nodorum]KAH6065539.1 hypothetical protein HBI67_129250 [Parastagonospora nodorum]KAH6076020.1 hypothetical protein HBI66_099020 [Parastagonospora nodorum]